MQRLTNKQLVVLIVVVVVLAILLAIGASRARQSNVKVIRAALAAAAQATSMQTKTVFVLNLPDRLRTQQRPFTKVTVALEGNLQKNDANQSEFSGTLNGELAGPGNKFFFNGGLAILADAIAFRLAEFPVLLNPSGSLVNKWTYVDSSLLQTNNSAAILDLLNTVASKMEYRGKERIDGQATQHFAGAFSADDEAVAADVLRASVSGNQAWHIIARLLDANNLKQLDLYIDESKHEFTKITANFVRPLKNGGEFAVANLELSLTAYNVPQELERPEKQATVKPGVFSKLFGSDALIDTPLEVAP